MSADRNVEDSPGYVYYSEASQPNEQLGDSNGDTYTVVMSQPSTMVVQPSPPPPPDYYWLAIFSCLCCFCPTGVIAYEFGRSSRDSAREGDYKKARREGRVAFWLSIAGIIAGPVFCIIVILVRMRYVGLL